MAKREHFSTSSWANLAGLIFSAASTWLSKATLFVVVVSLIAVAVVSFYYAIWRRLQSRST